MEDPRITRPDLFQDLAKAERIDQQIQQEKRSAIDAMMAKLDGNADEFARQRNAQAAQLKQERHTAGMDMQELLGMSKQQLAREVMGLHEKLGKMDLMALVARARTTFQHKEAFMLMRYVSEGGTDEKLIWNSRDGVTPFQVHIDGMKYTHDMKMQGPFFDRPEGIVGQWETRTEMEMMLAWRRVLNKAMLLGRMTEEKVIALQNDPDAARGNWLQIGLRSMATGRYTDEETRA